jgi:uncharacterized membrane protein YraQ (UPF0718 family)
MRAEDEARQSERGHGIHHHHQAAIGSTIRLSSFIQLTFIAAAVALVVLYRHSPAFATLSITFVSIFLEALPFMLLGSLVGGFIEVFVSRDAIGRLLPARTWQAIVLAAGLGLIFPVCECAIVPVVRRLLQKGLPLGAGIAFLLGGPIVNPLVAVSTAVAYGYDWSMAVERMLIGYLIAVTVGGVIELSFKRQNALIQDSGSDPDTECAHPQAPVGITQKILGSLQHAALDFIDIGRFLVFGAFIASVLQTLLARGDLTAVAESPLLSILVMMLLAVVLNLCSEADAFVAASFRTSLALPAQLAFMVLGPMLDIKLILMYFRLFRKRLILVLSSLTFVSVLAAMVVRVWMG